MALKMLKSARSRKRLSLRDFPDEKNCPNQASNQLEELTLVINAKNVHTQITRPIGEGSYSKVYEGSWESYHGLKSVAVKMPDKVEAVDTHLHILQLFLKEAAILSNLKHPNIIRMYGIVLDPVKMITEFAIMGDLLSYLKIHDNVFTAKRMHNYAEQIATAMDFLKQQGIVHRNLAAKSIVVRNHDQVKLSRFRDAEYLNENGIFQSNNPISPERIAWSSLEVLQGIYSTASDVWSYGITLWEIYSLGDVPWNGSSSTEITDAYLSNRQLDRPKRCHQLIYGVMLRCWNIYPEQRISFNDICSALNEIPYEEVMTTTECHPAEDDGDNLCYKPGDKIVVVDKHTDAWWTGIHTLTGKCGWFQVNNTQSDVTPLDTLKRDIKQKKKHLPSITIGLPTNIMHNMHIGRDGVKWYDHPLSSNASKNNLATSAVRRSSSLPLSINTLQDYNGEILKAFAVVSPVVQRKQVPITPQSPLTKTALTPIYGNVGTLNKVHTLHADLSFTASCPDIPSHTYHNSNNNKKSKLPEFPASNYAKNSLRSTSVTSSNTDGSSHYQNVTDMVGEKATPNVSISPTTTPVNTALTKEGPSDHGDLVEVIKKQLPDIPRREITQSLMRNDGNTEQAVKDIKLSQLTGMKLNGITENDCRIILERCNWDLSKAAAILCSL